MSWFNGFEEIVRTDVPLRGFTSYRLGGPARWLCQPRDDAEDWTSPPPREEGQAAQRPEGEAR